METERTPSLLLQACCAPCTTHPYRLLSERYRVTVYFYNPNIHPAAEYEKRLRELERFAGRRRFPLITGPYDAGRWFELTRGLEEEPEGGRRCPICYRMRLEETARLAAERGFDLFTTALSVSPHKNAAAINRIGREIAVESGVPFLEADFKKKEGFKISCGISREEGFYRQHYCGCRYSIRE
ncbi:epoxyqueuosine reductase QueH [bacterium]|nr:epoxyqueuosine reductase QueH [bacterium]